MKKIFYPIAFMAVALLVFAMLAAPRALASPSAATLTVNSTLDEPDSNVNDGQCISTPSGKCTLRAAVMQANVVNVATTILVPSGIYTLTVLPVGLDGPETGDLDLTTPASGNPVITITGADASTTIIDANQIDRVFYIATGRTASISGVTIRNGYALGNGGGIFNAGTMMVNNSVISGNYAGGGGGIFNNDVLDITNSTISQNNAKDGGGIENNYSLTVKNSTIYGNGAHEGGGILNSSASNFFVVNSTLSQNSATIDGGGIYNNYGSANVYNTSIVFNSADTDIAGGSAGGVYNNATLVAIFNLRNTLVAGNNVSNSPIYDDCTGTLNSYGRNLFWLVTGCTVNNAGGASWGYLNSLNTLGPLQNNGGPTFTHALLQGSNAIDGGDPVSGCTDYNGSTIATDQRGAARVVGVRCDIGAFEYRPPLYLPLIRR